MSQMQQDMFKDFQNEDTIFAADATGVTRRLQRFKMRLRKFEGALFQNRSFYFVTNVTDVTHHSQRFSEMGFLFLLHAAEIPQNNLRMARGGTCYCRIQW